MTPLRSFSRSASFLLALLFLWLPFASSAHSSPVPVSRPSLCDKYLYAHGNPVNGWDPTGHENLNTMQIATAISVSINTISAGINLRKGNYAAATLDLVGAGLGAFGLFGGPPSALFPQLASVGGAGSATLSSAQLAKLWQSVLAGASLISQGVALGELTAFAMSATGSEPSGSSSNGSSGGSSNSDDLDWSVVSSEGETRVQHVALHAVNDLQKKLHGVFYGNPIEVIREAWQIKRTSNLQPVNPGGPVDIYVIPRSNAGFQGGYAGQGQNLNNVVIITQKESSRLITGYPAGAGN